ncbi:hypothetical protein K2173_005925 [Erythroxylum novogranatense]|uniref:GYF domain-containing protein n=1 Tax=Erythroxylum novogranatense TaxID=1862640 RepID=A0AAV8U676_9ROSI|nr:hypothetical protein K2173_005925 [Erythroxylum novogranatense]
MADSKLDLPDDLLSSKPSDHSWAPPPKASGGSEMEKVPLVLTEDSKDQFENSIPLSPQWLYTKPSETKLDMRGPSSVCLGNSGDPSQKEAWRLDGSEDKKDWRRIASESEGSRRWREEERETGLLGGRRDRRKTDRRTESVSIRDTIENRVLASSDRWHDGSNRNSAHETRRDSKWSSRWGPEEKDKESRIEKRADAEKEKDDTQNENHPSTGSNRLTSERDSDSRDKWRPRHRMEIHSSGSSSYRAAPGFGLERGRTEGSNLGFTLGRGRSNAIGRASSATICSAAHPYKNGSSIGKLNLPTDTFCYPRGKLLDIYRSHKLDPYFGIMPEKMYECPPITELGFVEPLAFVTPATEEEAILTDIWKGKLTSSGIVYNASKKSRSSENISGVGEDEVTEGKQGIAEETADTFHELADEEVPQSDSSWSHGSNANALNEKEVDYRGESENANILTAKMLQTDGVYRAKQVATPHVDVVESWQMPESTFTECTEPGTSLDVKSKLPDDSSTLFGLTSSEHTQIDTHSHLGTDNELKELDGVAAPEDLYFFYIDPSGNTQGPFLGADIILWFEEGYFGTELPVRLADTPEGTPFHNLGDVMPHLKLRGETFSKEVEKSVPSVKSDPSIPILESTNSSASIGLSQSFSDLDSLASQQPALSRISKPEASLKLPQTDCQSLLDFVAQDEEIVFPGRPSSISYPNVKSAGNIHDLLATANTQTLLPNELVESGLPYQKDTKLHPFGLLWSELEGSHTRPSETSDVPVNVGRAVSYGALNDTASAVEKRADVFRPETLPASDSIQDAFAACRLSLNEQEPNNFDLTEQLMSLQFQQQQQLQQRNMLSSHSRMNESFLENVPSQNPIRHQQLANHTASDLEHLLALRRQQQQQQQLQLQQQHQLQQQQYFNQQKLLEEQQQSQVRYALFEQLMHAQIPDPGLPHSHIDPIRANSGLDQVLLEQQLLQEMHQRSHHPVRHFIPQVEQLAQSKFGLVPQREQQRDLFELLSRGHHGQVQSLEHKILQEQLHARQLSMALRQRRNMEEERRIDPVWPINENDNFLGNIASNNRAHTSGISPLDFFQQLQLQSHDDQLAQLQRTLSSQDRHQQELFEPAALPFDRSLSLPAGASGMNMDAVNAMVHAHGLNIHELNTQMQSSGQVVAFSTGIPSHSHHPMVPNQFHASNLEAIDGHWSENNGKVTNDWMESRFQQFNANSEQPKRESEVKVASEDQSSWMSDGSNDKSRRLLMELLHQKSGHQSADLLQVNDGISFERRVPCGLYSGSSSLDHPFSPIPGQGTTLNNSFSVGSYGSNMSEPADLGTADEQDYLVVEGRRHGSKNLGLMNNSVSEIHDGIAEKVRLASRDRGEIPVNAISRQASHGIAGDVAGFYNDKVVQNSSAEDISINHRVALKVQENILPRRPPVSRASSSQEGLAELVSDTTSRGKTSVNSTDAGNPINQANDSKREVRFRRTSSCSDADVSEPSFIDMLKSNTKKSAAPEVYSAGLSESSDGAQGARSSKKKGKKGRQIDPALLGFKVTSNRIMMGEIQRVED